jgi:mRNA interferase MazF
VIRQGDVRWADLEDPKGSESGFRRPVVVVQGDRINRSRIATALCVPLTSNLRWAEAPGNLLLSASFTGLPRDSVANVSLLVAVNKSQLSECCGQLSGLHLSQVLNGIDVILGRG